MPFMGTPKANDSNREIVKNIAEIDVLGRKLMCHRAKCTNPAVELSLISEEANLIRHLSRVHYWNTLRDGTNYPSLYYWLQYVNIPASEIQKLVVHIKTLPNLAAMNDKDIFDLCGSLHISAESRRRLRKSCYCIKRYIMRWKDVGIEPVNAFLDRDLAWISFDRLLPNDERHCDSESTIGSVMCDSRSGIGTNMYQSSLPTCSPPSPGVFNFTSANTRLKILNKLSQTSMAILRSKERLSSGSGDKKVVSNVISPNDGLTRSHSHESSMQIRLSSPTDAPAILTSSRSIGDCVSAACFSKNLCPPTPISIDQSGKRAGGTLPRSSISKARAAHSIPHQWHRKKGFRIATENCYFCQRQLNFLSEYDKCRSCKWKVHPQCKMNIGDSCGFTPDYLKKAIQEMFLKNSDKDGWTPTLQPPTFQSAFAFDTVADSSSSTNSSAPSTPAFQAFCSNSAAVPTLHSPYLRLITTPRTDFLFPESMPEVPDIVVDSGQSDVQQRLLSSLESDSTANTGDLGSSEGTLIVDSFGSLGQYSDSRENFSGEKHEISPGSCSLNRDRWSNGTIRMPNSWIDVTIPYSQIHFKKQSLIGRGRFGEVHRASWFGDVAVKFLNMDYVDEENQLEAFKADVVSFKNTRHDNLILFMGCCFDQRRLGIVMYYCKGHSLYRSIHELNEKPDFAQIIDIATQICHGLSYLHTKNIIHKDLRSKNIFIENCNRVIITDFGFFSVKRLALPERNHTLVTPKYWLSYASPELIKSLSPKLDPLPFSEKSDVFAFGTIWFELMTHGFPFSKLPSDLIIWQVGRGITGSLTNVNVSREAKEVLASCWSYADDERPSVCNLEVMLQKLPKKRLNRSSPSFPVSRSYESMF